MGVCWKEWFLLLGDSIVSTSSMGLPRHPEFTHRVDSYLQQQKFNGTPISAQPGCLQGWTLLETFTGSIFVSSATVQSVLDIYVMFLHWWLFVAGQDVVSAGYASHPVLLPVSTFVFPLSMPPRPQHYAAQWCSVTTTYHVQVMQSSYCSQTLHQIYSINGKQ